MDSIPVVVITGQVPTHLIGNDAFQEVDIVGITRPCTKHNYLVKNVDELAQTIKEAFYIARSGRPGPVLVDLPKDVVNTVTTYQARPRRSSCRSYNPTYKPNIKQLHKVVELIKKARRPMIFAGGGVILSKASEGADGVRPEGPDPRDHLPHGAGGFPGTDPLWLGHDRHARHLPGQHVPPPHATS